MKRMSKFCLELGIVMSLFVACANVKTELPEEPKITANGDSTLIVYLSRTRNTEVLAEIIQQNVGGRLVSLELVNPYPDDYNTTVSQVAEENRTGFLPPLETFVDSIEKYKLVFIGFPTWGMQLPPPIKSFLNQYDFQGKTVVPFNTNAGYGIGSSFDTVRQLCPRSTILEGFTTRGGIERDGVLFVMEGEKEVQVKAQVKEWLEQIGLL